MQLLVSNKRFVKVHDVKSKKEFMYTLKLFRKEVWDPKAFIVNGAQTVKSTKVQQLLDVPDRCLCNNDHILVGYKKSSG